MLSLLSSAFSDSEEYTEPLNLNTEIFSRVSRDTRLCRIGRRCAELAELGLIVLGAEVACLTQLGAV